MNIIIPMKNMVMYATDMFRFFNNSSLMMGSSYLLSWITNAIRNKIEQMKRPIV